MLLTCDMKIPGSFAPNGTHEWSVPPMMLNPSDPLFFGRMTSCKWEEKKSREEEKGKTTIAKINFRLWIIQKLVIWDNDRDRVKNRE